MPPFLNVPTFRFPHRLFDISLQCRARLHGAAPATAVLQCRRCSHRDVPAPHGAHTTPVSNAVVNLDMDTHAHAAHFCLRFALTTWTFRHAPAAHIDRCILPVVFSIVRQCYNSDQCWWMAMVSLPAPGSWAYSARPFATPPGCAAFAIVPHTPLPHVPAAPLNKRWRTAACYYYARLPPPTRRAIPQRAILPACLHLLQH